MWNRTSEHGKPDRSPLSCLVYVLRYLLTELSVLHCSITATRATQLSPLGPPHSWRG